jgi:endonuclease YncB( thermonuclease family)
MWTSEIDPDEDFEDGGEGDKEFFSWRHGSCVASWAHRARPFVVVEGVDRRSARPSAFLMRTVFVVGFLLVSLVSFVSAPVLAGEAYTKVFINGQPTPVTFNDGDSFRPHAGPFKGSQSRLAGFNTLESFGAVHSWGTWSARELWVLSKLATKNAQRGVWHCETDGKRDGYGRLLMICKDLAKSHIEQGLAMVMSVDQKPGDPELIEVQREAIRNRRGMWAHGIPSYVLSSLHATSEGGGKDGKTYNRLISTVDGHSEKWVHTDDYAECRKVCRPALRLAPENVGTVVAALRKLEAFGDAEELDALRFADEFLSFGSVTSGGPQRAALDGAMGALKEQGVLTATTVDDSCHVYVDFRRRFGGDRAVCLR